MRQQLVGGLRENYLNRHKPGHGCYGRTIVFLTSQRRVRGLRDNYSEPGNVEGGGCGTTIQNQATPSAGVAGELFIVKQFLVPG